MLAVALIGYLTITVLVGILASRFVNDSRDYVLAGRRLPMFLAASAMFATWFGSETILGASSEFVTHGLLGVIEDPFGASLCLLLIGIFFARPLYRMDILTFGDFYRVKYNQKVELIASIFLVLSYFGWIAAQLIAMGIIINVIFDLPIAIGVLVSAATMLLYTYFGGMWSVSITDFMQTVIIIGGLIYLTVDVLINSNGITPIIEQAPEHFFDMLPEPDFYSIIYYITAWITIGLGSIPQQDVFQRVMSAKTERIAVRASYLGAFMYLTVAMMPLLIVLSTRLLQPDLAGLGDTQLTLPMMVLNHSSTWIKVLFFGALLSAILSTCSGATLAPATILAENLIRPFIRQINDRQFLLILRLSVVFITLIAVVLALVRSNIYELVGESSILSLVSLFVPMVAALYWKRATATGALLSMISGIVTWLIFQFFNFELPGVMSALAVSGIFMVAGSLAFGKSKAAAESLAEISLSEKP